MFRPLVVLLGLVAVAAFLRLASNDYLLPLLVEPDVHCPIQVVMIEEGTPDPHLDKNWGSYPHLISRATVLLTDPAPAPARDAGLAAHLAAAADPVRRVRTLVALLGLLAVPGTWLLARRFMGPGWALVAAGLMATSLLACHFGAQGRPHGAAVSFFALSLWGWARVAARGTWWDYVWASLFSGLTVATLQSGLALGFPALAAHLVSAHRRGGAAWKLGGRHALQLDVPLGFLFAAIALAYPFVFAESAGRDGAQLAVGGGQLQQSGHRLIWSQFNGSGFGILATKLLAWEPALALALVVALAGWMVGRATPGAARGGWIVVWAYAVPYLLVNGLYERVYERFLLPVVPLICVAGAWGLARLWTRWPKPALGVVGAALLLVPSTVIAGKLTLLRARPSTQALAADWLRENSAPGERILVTRATQLPLFESAVSRVEETGNKPLKDGFDRVTWDSYQDWAFALDRPEGAWDLVWIPPADPDPQRFMRQMKRMNDDPRAYVRNHFGEWLVAELFTEDRVLPALGKVHAEFVRQSPGVVARFSPDSRQPDSGHPLVYQDEVPGPRRRAPWMAWRVLWAERLGATIEILKPPHQLPPRQRQ